MKISVAYIVKNEEANIEKSILSCRKAVDEIIVYDTGSTDNTIKICKSLGAKVYEGKWENDFAKARNFALSKCTGDYILVLDADEFFEKELKKNDLKKALSACDTTEDVDVFAIKCKDVDMKTKKIHYELFACKVLKNHRNLKYVSPIHEYVVNGEGERVYMTPLDNMTTIIHSGYTDLLETNKIQRNIDILESIEDKMPMHYFYLAREYLAIKQFDKIEQNIDKFFEAEGHEEFIDHSNIGIDPYFIKLFVLRKQDRFEEGVKLLEEVQKKFPNNPKVYYEFGNQFFVKDKAKAKEYFLKAIKVNHDHGENSVDINTFKSFEPQLYFLLSSCCFFLGERQAAISHSIVSCMLDKKNAQYLSHLCLMLDGKNYQHNIEALTKIYAPKGKEDYEFLTKTLYGTQLKREFCYFASVFNKQYQGNSPEIFYAMGLTGFVDNAIQILDELKQDSYSFVYVTLGILSQNKTYLEKLPDWVDKRFVPTVQYFLGEEQELSNFDYELIAKIYACVVLNANDLINEQVIEDIVNNCSDQTINLLIKNLMSTLQIKPIRFVISLLKNSITSIHLDRLEETVNALEKVNG